MLKKKGDKKSRITNIATATFHSCCPLNLLSSIQLSRLFCRAYWEDGIWFRASSPQLLHSPNFTQKFSVNKVPPHYKVLALMKNPTYFIIASIVRATTLFQLDTLVDTLIVPIITDTSFGASGALDTLKPTGRTFFIHRVLAELVVTMFWALKI